MSLQWRITIDLVWPTPIFRPNFALQLQRYTRKSLSVPEQRATHVLISSLHVYTKYCSLAINELNGHQWQWSPAPTIFFDIYVQNLRLHECMSVRRATIGRNNRAKCAWISKASRLLQYAPFTIPSETHKTAQVLPLKAHPPCVTPHASCHLQTDFLGPLLQTVDTVCRHTATTMSTNWRRYSIA